MHDTTAQLVAYLGGAVVFLGVLALRMRRAMQSRPFRLQYIWVLPVLFLVLTALTLAAHPPQGGAWLWLALALLVGLGMGWVSGVTIHLEVDPVSRAVRAKASPVAMVFIVALVLLRLGMRTVMVQAEAAYHLPAALIQAAFLTFALGLFLTRSLEMGLRAHRLRRAAVGEVFA